MAFSASANDSTNVLANVAARLMGRPTNASTLAALPSAKAFTPQPSAESESKASPQSANEPHAAKENMPPAHAPSGSSVPKGDTSMTEANAGPPLLGTANQISAAREFARSATAGSSKSRPTSRRGRQRLFTQEPEQSLSVASSSPRSSTTTTTTQHTAHASSSRVDANSTSRATGFDALHDRPLVYLTAAVAPTPAPSPIASPFGSKSTQSKASSLNEGWNAFTTQSAKIGNDSAIIDMPKSTNNGELSHAHPPTALPSKMSAVGPPHLRSQLSSDKIPKPEAELEPCAMSKTLKETPKKHLSNGVDEPNVLSALKMMKKELAAMSERLTCLEQDSFTLQKQLEIMTQAEERRKFLGTDDAKVPFALNVNYGGNKFCKVQANVELKIYELVRRIRTKVDLANTANPRITVNDKMVGHGMMLGEVGVSKDNAETVSVTFSYDEI